MYLKAKKIMLVDSSFNYENSKLQKFLSYLLRIIVMKYLSLNFDLEILEFLKGTTKEENFFFQLKYFIYCPSHFVFGMILTY